MDYDQKKPFDPPKTSGPTIPPSCHDQACPLNKNAGGMNLHYHCPHCCQPYVDLKVLFSHMVKKHSNSIDPGPAGLAATKVNSKFNYIKAFITKLFCFPICIAYSYPNFIIYRKPWKENIQKYRYCRPRLHHREAKFHHLVTDLQTRLIRY